jgi:hypothetical protein
MFYKRWGVGRGMDCLEGGMHADHEALFRCIEGVVIKANLVIVMGGVHADIPPDDIQGIVELYLTIKGIEEIKVQLRL